MYLIYLNSRMMKIHLFKLYYQFLVPIYNRFLKISSSKGDTNCCRAIISSSIFYFSHLRTSLIGFLAQEFCSLDLSLLLLKSSSAWRLNSREKKLSSISFFFKKYCFLMWGKRDFFCFCMQVKSEFYH